MGTLRKIADLTLWYKLLENGMVGKCRHFYGAIWTAGLCIVTLSLLLLFSWDGSAAGEFGRPWAWFVGCPLLLVSGYVTGRLHGSLALLALALAVAAAVPALPAEPNASFNWGLFGRGVGLFAACAVFTGAVYSVAPFPYSFVGYEGWPHRRAMTFVLVLSGVVGLGLLAVATKSAARIWMPWHDDLSGFLSEARWPVAVATWIWFTIAYCLSNYDAEVLPPLLRRIGLPNVPNELSLEHGHMVEYLIAELPDHPEL